MQMLATPRRRTLASGDRFYRRLIAESKRPARQRAWVPVPNDPWLERMVGGHRPEHAWKYEWPLTGLALLETALAVRMHRLTRGAYPDRLAATDRRWLPAIPRDQWDQSVVCRMRDGRPILYSLGPDGRDDGGQPIASESRSPSPPGDLVFGRLFRRRGGSP